MTPNKIWLIGIFAGVLGVGCTDEELPTTPEAIATDEAELTGGNLAQLDMGDFLFPGQQLVADQCYFNLVMQYDGNLVSYGDNGAWVNWYSGTYAGGPFSPGGYATLQPDGNFVIYNWNDQAVWANNVVGNWSGSRLVMQIDGNIVEYSSPLSFVLWNSGTVRGPALPTLGCRQSASKTHVVGNVDRDGTPIGASFAVPHPSWCGYYCAQDAHCVGYSVARGQCTLRSTLGPLRAAQGAVTGWIVR
jgi:hypothetical protein